MLSALWHPRQVSAPPALYSGCGVSTSWPLTGHAASNSNNDNDRILIIVSLDGYQLMNIMAVVTAEIVEHDSLVLKRGMRGNLFFMATRTGFPLQ